MSNWLKPNVGSGNATYRNVPCPVDYCQALPGGLCRTKSGKPTYVVHAKRVNEALGKDPATRVAWRNVMKSTEKEVRHENSEGAG